VVTPGVATLLRSLAAGSIAQQAENPSSGPMSVAATVMQTAPEAAALGESGDMSGSAGGGSALAQIMPRAAGTSMGMGSSGMACVAAGVPGMVVNAVSPAGKGSVNAGLNSLTPVIEADPRLNSVIVYDAPEKMPIYEALIRELDAGTPQIQIEAM